VMNKKGISPLIATVLLIGFTIVLAALVIRWGSELFSSQIKTQTCDNEATISCTSDVDIDLTQATFNTVTDTLTVSLVSNGKKEIKGGYIVRLHTDTGEVKASTVTAAAANELGGFETVTFPRTDAINWGSLDEAMLRTNTGCQTKFCGVSIMPIIIHTTNKGDTCTVTCGQSEQRRTFTDLDIP